jgi:hypothetical protein
MDTGGRSSNPHQRCGFRRPWFTQVERLGWSWIGRIRAGVCVARDPTHWAQASVCFAKGHRQSLSLERLLAHAPISLRLRPGAVSAPRGGWQALWPCRSWRHAQSTARSEGQRARAVAARTLAQLRSFRAEEIVALYGLRMQIEETFRDSKSSQLGMGLELSQSRSAPRLHALLLIATLAAFLLWHIGQLAEAEGLHRRFKATTRRARELSIITLAKLLCALDSLPLTNLALQVLDERLGLRI